MGTATFILALVALFQVVHGYKNEEQSAIVTVYSLGDDKTSKNDLLKLLSKILYDSHLDEDAEIESPKKEVVSKNKREDSVSKNPTYRDKTNSGEYLYHGEKLCPWNKTYHGENLCLMENSYHGNKPVCWDQYSHRSYRGNRLSSTCNCNCWNRFPGTCNDWSYYPCSCNYFPNNYCNWNNWSPWNSNVCYSSQGNSYYWNQPCYPGNSDGNGMWSYCPYCGRWSYISFNKPVMSVNSISNDCTICTNADIKSPVTDSDLVTLPFLPSSNI